MNSPVGLSRRDFARYLLAGSAVSLSALEKLSAGLTAFSMAGVDGSKLVDYLREKHNLVIRTTGSMEAGTYGVRVSTPIYVSTKEVALVVDGVRTLMSHKT